MVSWEEAAGNMEGGGSPPNPASSDAADQFLLAQAGVSGMMDSMASGVRQGLNRMGELVTPQSPITPANDPVSLSTGGRAGPDLHLAVARVHEQRGEAEEAERHYRQAVELAPRSAGALASFARFKDRQGELATAVEYYQRALNLDPDDAAIVNDLGLCFARRGMHREAVSALERAVRLQPESQRYRNNIATVLVEAGNYETAFAHLRSVHRPSVAHYNMGYLLHKKGHDAQAMQHFSAASLDGELVEARTWLRRLAPGDHRSETPEATERGSAPPAIDRMPPPGAADGGGRLPVIRSAPAGELPRIVSGPSPRAAPGQGAGWAGGTAGVAPATETGPIGGAADSMPGMAAAGSRPGGAMAPAFTVPSGPAPPERPQGLLDSEPPLPPQLEFAPAHAPAARAPAPPAVVPPRVPAPSGTEPKGASILEPLPPTAPPPRQGGADASHARRHDRS